MNFSKEKKSYFVFATSVFLSFLIGFAALYLTFKFASYKTKFDELVLLANKLTIVGGQCFPKVLEHKILVFTTTATISSFFLFFHFFKRQLQKIETIPKCFFYCFAIGIPIALSSLWIYSITGIDEYWLTDHSLFASYFDQRFIRTHAMLTIIISVLTLIVFHINENKNNKIVRYVLYFFLFCPLCTILIYTPNDYPAMPFHFNAVYFSLTQVVSGSPMLHDGFTNTYGLYPHFLSPIFHLIPLSVLNFSILLSIFIVISFLIIFYFVRQFAKDDLVFFLISASSITSYLYWRHISADPYFQYWPMRTMCPLLSLLFSFLYFKRQTFFRFFITSSIVSASVLWNPDSGIITFLAWLITITFISFQNNSSYKFIVGYALVRQS